MAWGLKNLSDEALDDLERTGGDITKLSDATLDEMEMWEKTNEPKPEAPKTPAWQSTIMGAADAASFGLADEIAGVGGAIIGEGYKKSRDTVRKAQATARKDNPNAYGAGDIAGTVATGVVGVPARAAGVALRAGTEAATRSLGGAEELNADAFDQALEDAGISAVMAGSLATAAPKLLEQAKKYGKQGAEWLAGKLGKSAEKMAERATGATRVQAEKFKEGTGRELLDRGVVGYGSTPGSVAKKAAALKEEAGQRIGHSLRVAEEQGIRVDRAEILDDLLNSMEKVKGNPAAEQQYNKLAKEAVKLFDLGELTPQRSEEIKRAYQKGVNYFADQLKPNTAAANRDVAAAYQRGTEKAMEANPNIAEPFLAAKKTYGLMSPVVDAAEARATQLNQNPLFGLNDLAAMATGGASGGPVAAAAAPALRRIAGSYGASLTAKGVDDLSKLLAASPGAFGRFAPVLESAVKRGPQAVAVTHRQLMKDFPEYASIFGEGGEE